MMCRACCGNTSLRKETQHDDEEEQQQQNDDESWTLKAYSWIRTLQSKIPLKTSTSNNEDSRAESTDISNLEYSKNDVKNVSKALIVARHVIYPSSIVCHTSKDDIFLAFHRRNTIRNTINIQCSIGGNLHTFNFRKSYSEASVLSPVNFRDHKNNTSDVQKLEIENHTIIKKEEGLKNKLKVKLSELLFVSRRRLNSTRTEEVDDGLDSKITINEGSSIEAQENVEAFDTQEKYYTNTDNLKHVCVDSREKLYCINGSPPHNLDNLDKLKHFKELKESQKSSSGSNERHFDKLELNVSSSISNKQDLTSTKTNDGVSTWKKLQGGISEITTKLICKYAKNIQISKAEEANLKSDGEEKNILNLENPPLNIERPPIKENQTDRLRKKFKFEMEDEGRHEKPWLDVPLSKHRRCLSMPEGMEDCEGQSNVQSVLNENILPREIFFLKKKCESFQSIFNESKPRPERIVRTLSTQDILRREFCSSLLHDSSNEHMNDLSSTTSLNAGSERLPNVAENMSCGEVIDEHSSEKYSDKLIKEDILNDNVNNVETKDISLNGNKVFSIRNSSDINLSEEIEIGDGQNNGLYCDKNISVIPFAPESVIRDLNSLVNSYADSNLCTDNSINSDDVAIQNKVNEHYEAADTDEFNQECDMDVNEIPDCELTDVKVIHSEVENANDNQVVPGDIDEIHQYEMEASDAVDNSKAILTQFDPGIREIDLNSPKEIPGITIFTPSIEIMDAKHNTGKRDSQPHITVTPADEIVSVNSSKLKSDSYHTETSQHNPSKLGGEILAEASSIDSQQDESDMDGLCPSMGDSYNVSPASSGKRVATPKSPVTVQEWVDSLPNNPGSRVDEDRYDSDWSNPDSLACTPFGSLATPIPKSKKYSSIIEDALALGDDATKLRHSANENSIKPSVDSVAADCEQEKRNRAVTLLDIQKALISHSSSSQMNWTYAQSTPKYATSNGNDTAVRLTEAPTWKVEQDELMETPETPPTARDVLKRRGLLAELRGKQSSFQSDASAMSMHSQNTGYSIESLLESRQLDPVEVLFNLGFGGRDDEEEGVLRIPPRFMNDSKVPGNDVDSFLCQEDELSELAESTEYFPDITTQALRRCSITPISPLMSNLIENMRESRQRLIDRNRSQEISTPKPKEKPAGLSRFASAAKAIGKKVTLTSKLSEAIGAKTRTNRLSVTSVLTPESRRFLEQQGQKSPEVPKRRLIIGRDSFSLGKNGEILDSDDDDDKKKEEVKEEIKAKRETEHEILKRKESNMSMMSSATSIDSREEEMLDELQLSREGLYRRSPQRRNNSYLDNDVFEGDTKDFQKLPKYLKEQRESGLVNGGRRKGIYKRLSSLRHKSLVSQSSSGSSWNDADHHIKEESFSEESSIVGTSLSGSMSPPDIGESRRLHLIARSPRIFTKESKDPDSSTEEDSIAECDTYENNMKRFKLHNIENKNSAFTPVGITRPVRGGSKGSAKEIKWVKDNSGFWSFESAQSFNTVIAKDGKIEKRFPLNRSSAVENFASIDRFRSTSQQEGSAIQRSEENEKIIKRFNSLPNVSPGVKRTFDYENEDLDYKNFVNERFIESVVNSMQTNMNSAMLAILQTCKSQMQLMDQLSSLRSSRVTSPSEPAAPSYELGAASGRSSKTSRTNMSSENKEGIKKVKTSVASVMTHLENCMTDISSECAESSPELSNAFAQMINLSHYQATLCAEIERLTDPNSNTPPPSSDQSLRAFQSMYPVQHSPLIAHSLPEYLNDHKQTANPTSTTSPLPNMATGIDGSVVHGGAITRSISESSLDGSTDMVEHRADLPRTKEQNLPSSPLFTWPHPTSTESILSNLVKEKVAQELHNLGIRNHEYGTRSPSNASSTGTDSLLVDSSKDLAKTSPIQVKSNKNDSDLLDIKSKLDIILNKLNST